MRAGRSFTSWPVLPGMPSRTLPEVRRRRVDCEWDHGLTRLNQARAQAVAMLPASTLVHLAAGGRDRPSPGPLCDDALATDRVRASSRQHPVQHRNPDGSLGLLGCEAAGPQPRSDQRLVATHGRSNQRTLAVANHLLPPQASLCPNQMNVHTLRGLDQMASAGPRRTRGGGQTRLRQRHARCHTHASRQHRRGISAEPFKCAIWRQTETELRQLFKNNPQQG